MSFLLQSNALFKICLFFLFTSAAIPVLGFAAAVRSANTEAELISEVTSVQPGKPFWVALRMKMDKEWHTYWKNSGDSGLATEIEWTLPEGFRADEIQWPNPIKISNGPISTYGFEGEVFLLIPLTPPSILSDNAPQTIRAKASWLACKVECIPGKGEFELMLPVSEKLPELNPDWVLAFSKARSELPLKTSDWKIEAGLSADKLFFQISHPTETKPFDRFEFYPYDPEVIDHAGEQITLQDGGIFELAVPRSKTFDKEPSRIEGVLISKIGWRGPGSEKGLQINLPINSELIFQNKAIVNQPISGFGIAILFAFIGGIILNLMPCVLPVLSLKILSLIEKRKAGQESFWKHNLSFTFGVLVSFWSLALLLILLRAGGEQIGWGFQLQSPGFLIFLISMLFLFALNLFGVFEVGLSLTRISHSKKSDDLAGSFLSGLIATLVATPCTAPFMGSALGYAITQPPLQALLIFTSLGLGMAFPFLLLSIFPALTRIIPKPGPWMIRLKQFLGFLLLLTVFWLAWILYLQTTKHSLFSLLIALGLQAIAAWIFGQWAHPSNSVPKRQKAAILVLLLMVISFASAYSNLSPEDTRQSQKTAQTNNLLWQPFSEAAVNLALQEGKAVFIDFTAAWCLTCQVNERFALNQAKVIEAFQANNFVLFKADWTNKDEKITKALARYGRNSIPLYVIHRNTSSVPLILPEIITPSVVLNAISGEQS